MENKTAAIKQLQQLMDEIGIIKDRPRFGEDFARWYRKAITTIEDVFGEDSEEVVEFQSIKLNPPHAILPEALLESIKAVNEDIGILDNREQHYYKERFSELHELLLAMIVRLRNS